MAHVLRRGCAAGILFAVAATAADTPKRTALLPQLRQGQMVTYNIRLRVRKQTRSESRVAMPGIAESAPVDVNRRIRAEVLDVALNARTRLVLRVQIENPAAAGIPAPKSFELAIRQDGSAVPASGAEELSPDDAAVWQAWVALFAIAWTLPKNGVKVGERWAAEEAITGTLLSGLYWKKESQYVRDDRCPTAQSTSERCAVLVTTSILNQRSSKKDATPDEFKLRQLRTMGTAKGRNETFIYVSLESGIVVRSSEEASQLMDVVIAKADGSNRVHYNIDAQSSTEIVLGSEAPVKP